VKSWLNPIGHSKPSVWLRSLIRRELKIVGQVDLDPVAFSNRDGRETIHESAHRLRCGLRGRIADIADDDDRTVLRLTNPPPEILREPREQADRGRCPNVDA
jgi:hypothetical protein